MLKHKYILLIFCTLCALPAAWAQPNRDLPTESVDVISDFDARLLDANKINVNPSLPPLDTNTKKQVYYVPPRPLTVQYEAPRLKPIGMRTVKAEKENNGYVKAGGGLPTSLYGEGGYYFGGSDKFDGKLWLRHHSLNADKSLENQRFFNNDVLLNGNVYLENNLAVEGRVGYSYDRVHFYGYDHDSLSFEEEAVRQDYKIFDVGGRLFNSERTENDLNFSAAPRFYLMNDYFSNKETGFDLDLMAEKWFAEKHPLRLVIRTDFTSYEDTVKQKLNNIYLKPSFTFHADFIKLKLGGNFASNRDIFTPFPDVELVLRVFGDGAQIFGAATGDLRKNTFRNLTDYNPFLEMRGVELRNTRFYNYYGGLKGNLGFLEYSAQAGYSTADNLALFQTRFNPDGITRFTVLYDTAQIFNLQGTVKIKPLPGLVVTGTLSQNVYTLNQEDSAWGLPTLEGNFNAVYTLLDGKANLRGALYIADGIPRLDREGLDDSDGVLLDLNLGGTYYFTDNVGAFLELNNLFNNKRERWHNYPMVGLNALVGITARF